MEDKEGLNPNCAFWQMQYFSLSLQMIFFFFSDGNMCLLWFPF